MSSPEAGIAAASALEAHSRRHQGLSDHLIRLQEARWGHGAAQARAGGGPCDLSAGATGVAIWWRAWPGRSVGMKGHIGDHDARREQ
jgi:hypothetical protein